MLAEDTTRAIQCKVQFDAPTQATGMAPQHRSDRRRRGAEQRHLRALEVVEIGIPRGGSCGNRDGEQGQRRNADPRGTTPAPHPLRSPRATRSPRPRSLPRERRMGMVDGAEYGGWEGGAIGGGWEGGAM
jgi:hypothetical protein